MPRVSGPCGVYLVGVRVEIKVLQEAGGEFAEEEVVGLVDGPHAPVRVVVGAGAGAEGPHCGGRECAPGEGPATPAAPGRDGAGCVCAPPHPAGCPRMQPRVRPPARAAGSRVQSGAVCQCRLSWVKHVRPGMLHVSLFCRRLSSLRSFFLRFCSRSSHTLSFSRRPFLGAHRAIPLTPPSAPPAAAPRNSALPAQSRAHHPAGPRPGPVSCPRSLLLGTPRSGPARRGGSSPSCHAGAPESRPGSPTF